MTKDAVARHIVETFEGVDVLEMPDVTFFLYDPERSIPHDRRHPFVTIVTSDAHDVGAPSRLSRDGVFRLNIGVTKETYVARFGAPPAFNQEGPVATGHDFSATDVVMPHPVYAPLNWVCVLNPRDSWPDVKELLAEAYDLASGRHERRAKRG